MHRHNCHETTRNHAGHGCCGRHEGRGFDAAPHARGRGRGRCCEEERMAPPWAERSASAGYGRRGWRHASAPEAPESGSAPVDQTAWLEARKQHMEARLAEINDELSKF